MRPLVLAALLLVFPLAFPSAAASPCAEGISTPYYVTWTFGSPSWAAVLQESNGVPGMQTEACEDADGRTRPSDTYVYRSQDMYPPCSGGVCLW